MPKFPHGPLAAGVIRTDDISFDASVRAEVDAAGGMWRAGDYYADAETIVATARANGVRALRLDARDLGFLPELPDLELPSLAVLSILGTLPSLVPLSGKRGLRIARLSMPEDGDLAPLRTWPDLIALVGRRFLGEDVPVPYLEDLAADDPRSREWIEATGHRLVPGS